eukprot:PITA_33457
MIKLSKGIPLQYRQRYLNLFKIYKDIFSWSYEDLKAFDTNIIHHKIPLKSGIKPCKQKLRKINPLLLPSIEEEVRKMLHAKIIVPLRMYMTDGFSGYNQVAVHPKDQKKTAFTTPWGTFMYAHMPFSLINAGGTFQRAMDIAFIGGKEKFLVVYLDDITVFSKTDEVTSST